VRTDLGENEIGDEGAGRLAGVLAGRYIPVLDRAVYAGTDERGAVGELHL